MIDVDVWVRGTEHATTYHLTGINEQPQTWSDADVTRLLSEMLLAIERSKNPGGEPPPVTLRGFNWIVSPYDKGGVVIHLEMQMGTASAGPFDIPEAQLTQMIQRAMAAPPAERVH